jgi:ATP-binding cassette subfamily C (CFTR/MRP) protein 1
VLQALLSKMTPARGAVRVGGLCAYVPQSPWVQNLSLRDNITFGLPFDEARYRAVVHACALELDFKILPNGGGALGWAAGGERGCPFVWASQGRRCCRQPAAAPPAPPAPPPRDPHARAPPPGDATLAGERGINLSGGQRQRLALARAAYHTSDLVLLDNPLSAVRRRAVQRRAAGARGGLVGGWGAAACVEAAAHGVGGRGALPSGASGHCSLGGHGCGHPSVRPAPVATPPG